MVEKLVGGSLWEEEVYEHLTTHVDNERGLLEEYQGAARDSGSAAFSYLVSLIIEDEIRHHQRFQQLADSLRIDAEFRRDNPPLPRLDNWGSDPATILALTEKLLDRERADARELRRLEKDLRAVKDTTIWDLLVRLMIDDTMKHIQILEFVKEHAGRHRR